MDIGLSTLLRDIGGTIQILGVIVMFYFGSKIYYNIRKAHQQPIYNTVEYHDCVLQKEEKH